MWCRTTCSSSPSPTWMLPHTSDLPTQDPYPCNISWVMLGKRLAPIHGVPVPADGGVSLVQVEGGTNSRSTKILPEVEAMEGADPSLLGGVEGGGGVLPPDIHNAAHPNPEVRRLLGILAVFVSCISSGFSGVYFERLVKRGKQTSLIIRNIQLGVFSIAFAVVAVSGDSRAIREHGFFQGYSLATWLVVLIQFTVPVDFRASGISSCVPHDLEEELPLLFVIGEGQVEVLHQGDASLSEVVHSAQFLDAGGGGGVSRIVGARCWGDCQKTCIQPKDLEERRRDRRHETCNSFLCQISGCKLDRCSSRRVVGALFLLQSLHHLPLRLNGQVIVEERKSNSPLAQVPEMAPEDRCRRHGHCPVGVGHQHLEQLEVSCRVRSRGCRTEPRRHVCRDGESDEASNSRFLSCSEAELLWITEQVDLDGVNDFRHPAGTVEGTRMQYPDPAQRLSAQDDQRQLQQLCLPG
ncbi:UDP-N-acetylglucosamine transporter [Chionoecetes opilio]|uniref:UDP-N-acetylglucosamine transporter n=1 Tax=Chionoecetes opilio TaxID=41210 RepID=A0A8J4XX46_CHIOP|nr:UDP-N-acetylglucosamine transporter [Chionoecetes opilio]